MFRRRAAFVWSIVVLFVACTGGGGEESGGPGAAAEGFILSQGLGDNATCPEGRLLVTDAGGNEEDALSVRAQRCALLHGMATSEPGRALYFSGGEHAFIADATDGSLIETRIPGGEQLAPNPLGLNLTAGGRYTVLASPAGDQAFLVDARTGKTTDLLGIDPSIGGFFGGSFAPDGSHLLVAAQSGTWLVPTADPETARQVPGGPARFSSDGTRLGLIEPSGDGSRVVVENADGTGPTEVARLPDLAASVSFVDGDRQLLLEQEGGLALLPVDGGAPEELLSLEGDATLPPWADPGGEHVIVATGEREQQAWQWIDIGARTAKPLPDLDGMQPLFSSIRDGSVFFVDKVEFGGGGRRFAALDLETGVVRAALDLDAAATYLGTKVSPGGRFALVGAQRGERFEIWLVPAEGGRARTLVDDSRGPVGATFSPSGDAVALATSRGEGQEVTTSLLLASTDGGEPTEVGEGLEPVWVPG